MSSNSEIITKFYQAFQDGNAEEMAACYHKEIVFEDPVFGQLHGEEAGDMWRMLLSRAKDLQVGFRDVEAYDLEGSAKWDAIYIFSKTNRKVHNKITAHFRFKDGKIIRHTDTFSFWRWSMMALGPAGFILGWTPFLKNKVSSQSLHLLQKYRSGKEGSIN